jgi:hypothetical protein
MQSAGRTHRREAPHLFKTGPSFVPRPLNLLVIPAQAGIQSFSPAASPPLIVFGGF